MTETELRKKVADIIGKWFGAEKGSPTHQMILSIYNNHVPLARGYKVTATDSWCAATAAAAYISAGIADYTGTECSCGAWITIAKQKGIWVEDDAHVPSIGDAIIYDWKDTGNGDDTTGHDHIGIVTSVNGNSFTVTEGNMNSNGKRVVGRRTMSVNGRYIRGYICPDFAKIARDLSPAAFSLSDLSDEDCYEIVKRGLKWGLK